MTCQAGRCVQPSHLTSGKAKYSCDSAKGISLPLAHLHNIRERLMNTKTHTAFVLLDYIWSWSPIKVFNLFDTLGTSNTFNCKGVIKSFS